MASAYFLSTCTSEKGIPNYNEFPDDIGKIIFSKCATSGCHTDASKDGAAGLSMESWDKLFEGGTTSACVIPYRHDYSTLFYSINTFTDLGITETPTMPYSKPALSREETILIRDWIDAGAPNRDGFVKFSDNSNRKKFYITNQGCDVVTVFDQATLLPMRYIDVGNTTGTESPHMIKISPDEQFWYVISFGGNSIQKYQTSDDRFVGEAILGYKNWNTVTISNDGQKAYCVDWSPTGDIAEVNLNTFAVTHHIGYNSPHGSCLNPAGDTLYITQQNSSNKLYKIPTSDLASPIEINLFFTIPVNFLNAHEVRFSPDGSRYFVTCQSAGNLSPEVRAFQASNDSLLAIISVGALPSEMSFSATTNYLFVTCLDDLTNFPGKRGSVAVINYMASTPFLVKYIYTGHQPHGIEVDDAKKMVYVANSNFSNDGPAPHHTSACTGRNGNVSFIDLNTLNMVTSSHGTSIKKVEVSVYPYSIAVRH